MRRQKLPPDTRLDWRDPDMPVLCPMNDGSIALLTPDEAQQDAADSMVFYDDLISEGRQGISSNYYRNDPLYYAARKRR